MPNLILRDANLDDAEPMLAIYRPFVEKTTVSFELDPPTLDDFRDRIKKAIDGWAWVVAEVDGIPVGYAYGGLHRTREAYRWSVETSAYIHPTHQGKGLGRTLYRVLIPRLAERGFCNAYAGITLPNAASVGFHQSMGFLHIGVFKSVGWKFNQWHDVSWWHLQIRETPHNSLN